MNVYTEIDSYLIKIGVATVNADGSISVQLDAIPVNGRLVIRDVSEALPPVRSRIHGHLSLTTGQIRDTSNLPPLHSADRTLMTHVLKYLRETDAPSTLQFDVDWRLTHDSVPR